VRTALSCTETLTGAPTTAQVNPHVAALLHAHAGAGQPPRALARQPGPAPAAARSNAGACLAPSAALAGVSAFAFQGTNAHAVLCAAPASAAGVGAHAPPWRRQRHWFTPVELHVLLVRAGAPAGGPGADRGMRFEARLDRPALAFLWDHRVAAAPLLPAAAMLELAAAAAAAAAQAGGLAEAFALVGVAIPAPLPLGAAPGGFGRVLSVALAEKRGALSIGSDALPASSVTHLTAALGCVHATRAPADARPDVTPTAARALTAAARGALRARQRPPAPVAAVASIDASSCAVVRLQPASQFRTHPALLDCATQAGAAFAPPPPQAAGGAAVTRVPAGIAAYRAGAVLAHAQAAHAVAAPPELHSDGSALGAYKVASVPGRARIAGAPSAGGPGGAAGAGVDVAGMMFKRMRRPGHGRGVPMGLLARPVPPTAAHMPYVLHWRAAQPAAAVPRAAGQPRPAPTRAPVAWRARPAAGAASGDARMRFSGATAALPASLRFVQCAAGAGVLELHTRGACPDARVCRSGAARPCAEQDLVAAGAAALLRVAAQERVAAACRHIDADVMARPVSGGGGPLPAPPADAFGAAVSGGAWLAPGLDTACDGGPLGRVMGPAGRPAWPAPGASGAVLVTGGLGEIGALAGAWLAAAGAPHVWLAGRSGRAAGRPHAAAAAAAALSLRGAGAMHALRCDAGTAAGASALARHARAGAGRALAGIVHAAGVLADAALPGQAPAALRAAGAPKAGAAARLAAALAGGALAAWAHCSSLSALLGTAGQGAYAAANAALGALAEQQQGAGAHPHNTRAVKCVAACRQR